MPKPSYGPVYGLLMQRMADESDIPDTDEIIAAALDCASAAVAAKCRERDYSPSAKWHVLAAIDALRGTDA